MEIITIVLKGELEHRDDLGNIETMRPGVIQKMTAGRGIRHSETNPSVTEPVELLQLWIQPSELHLEPGYEMVSYNEKQIKNCFHPIISPSNPTGSGHINQNATIFLAKFSQNFSSDYPISSNRNVFLFVISGSLTVNDSQVLKDRDSIRVTQESNLSLQAASETFVLLIDLP
jgi:redox-sensitive bicupin YhaK (pirin superfamily)